MRDYSALDHLLTEAGRAMAVLGGGAYGTRPSPAADLPVAQLEPVEQAHVAGLMRINHVGEVCAQALYYAQASQARDPQLRTELLDGAVEEADHLNWCAERLAELDARPSRFNPLFYVGAYTFGWIAARLGDGPNLSFVVETERQVEAHLDDHIGRLPATDLRSRAILVQMRRDESAHADWAQKRGGQRLGWPLSQIMQRAADVMRAIAYRV